MYPFLLCWVILSCNSNEEIISSESKYTLVVSETKGGTVSISNGSYKS